jgi:hypothetical protein
MLLEYFIRYEADARAVSLDVFRSDGKPMLPRFAAATWYRVPGLLRGIIALARENLGLEVDALLRVLLEIAIVALWVGKDEERAQATRDNTLARMKTGLARLKEAGVEPSPAAQYVASQWYRSSSGRTMPSLEKCAEQVRDTERLPAGRRIASALYRGFYDNYSVASHAELRAAEKLARGVPNQELRSAITDAVEACAAILMAVGDTLGRDDEIKPLLAEIYKVSP